MGLTSIEFIILLPVVVFVFYCLPRKARYAFLLTTNVLFLFTFGIWTIIAVLTIAVFTYVYGRILENHKQTNNKLVAVFSILTLVIPLILLRVDDITNKSFVAPLGISFYTLEAISYLADVYMGKIHADKNFFRIVTYLTLFPNITSGPIYRYSDFLNSNERVTDTKADYSRIMEGFFYCVWGLFLKLVIADRLAIPVGKIFEEFESIDYSGVLLVANAFAYSIQIYTDFAGYSAMAIGIARMLGFDLPNNFMMPYFSRGIKDFWGKWHISFSAWLRDYVYIPLGGNRKGIIRKNANVIVTFLVSGLWHGFRVHFIVWGMIHALYQIIENACKSRHRGKLFELLDTFITFIMVTFAWIFFKTETSSAIKYICGMFKIKGAMFGGLNLGVEKVDIAVLAVSLLLVFCIELLAQREKTATIEYILSKPLLFRCALLGMVGLFILIFGIYGNQHDASYFIYRDF